MYPVPFPDDLHYLPLKVPSNLLTLFEDYTSMTPLQHKIYISILVSIVVAVTFFLAWNGYDYYNTSIEERFYHERHHWFKPAGIYGHGLGIVGTLLILIGVVGYIAKKRYKLFGRLGRLKYWLEFHIFLCTLGPIMILFHTAFKFGGIVSVSFWSMILVVLSGVIGRFIYIQIPRTIEGRELTLDELRSNQTNLAQTLQSKYNLSTDILDKIDDLLRKSVFLQNLTFKNFLLARVEMNALKKKIVSLLASSNLRGPEIREAIKPIQKEMKLLRQITQLNTMVQLLKYWHVAHLPFALIMLLILIIHVGVTLAFGYKWIF
jgi:hypothetical protein